MTQPLLQAADLRGAAQLTTDAVLGLTGLVEAMHARIATLQPLARAAAAERTRGVTGLVYQTVRGITHLVGASAEALLAWLGPSLTHADANGLPRAEREAVVAALNGLVGDHLAATGNPLAIDMALKYQGRLLALDRTTLRLRMPEATPRLLVLLHGLCMNHLQWQRDGHDHATTLARGAGYTPVHLHYNSGLSISTNGRVLAHLMERLFDAWPVPIERFALLGHSMGGLVAHSAMHHGALASRGSLRWPGRVTDLVSLGTPHQGAPLERAGHGVGLLLGAAPYAAPLARLGTVRSAGMRDLHNGEIVLSSKQDPGSHRSTPVPLPSTARCYAIAGSLGPAGDSVKGHLLGDGLVTVASALGQHREPMWRLDFEPERRAVVYEKGHLELLESTRVAEILTGWLA